MLINLCTIVLTMIHGVESLSLKQPQKVLVKLKEKAQRKTFFATMNAMNAPLMLSLFLFIQFICKVDGAGKLEQKISLTKAVEKLAIIDCQLQGNCWGYIHWYQQKDGETLKRILYTDINDGSAKNDVGFESIKSEMKAADHFVLKITKLKKEHSAMYYCACWVSDKKEFGTGTRLYVTERGNDQIKPPKLSGYLPSKKDNHGRQTMLCQARGMFPNLVKFEWKKKDGGQWNDPGGNTVEQNNEGSEVTVTSMLIMDKDKVKNDDYRCTVTHEGKSQNLDIKIENSKPAEESKPDKADVRTSYIGCPTSSTKEPNIMQISGDSEQIPSMSLFVYAYGVMLVKNGLFFCIVSIFLLQRNAGKKDKKSSET